MSNKFGPIILVEDDAEDHQFLLEAYKALERSNEVKLFSRAQEVLDYLLTTQDKPFIIISEVQLQGMDGIELRKKILESDYLRAKSIPFVYLTTNKDKKDVVTAYELQVQGYFEKKNSVPDLQRMLKKILDYWEECVHINNL